VHYPGLRRTRPPSRLPTGGRGSPRDLPRPGSEVKKFHDKEALNFALLADEDHAVAEMYGVWVTKSMYGRTYLGNERTSFVIDPAGKVTDVLRKVKPAQHDELVLQALDRVTPASV
jgi:peroxiredoxin Q/BCP